MIIELSIDWAYFRHYSMFQVMFLNISDDLVDSMCFHYQQQLRSPETRQYATLHFASCTMILWQPMANGASFFFLNFSIFENYYSRAVR